MLNIVVAISTRFSYHYTMNVEQASQFNSSSHNDADVIVIGAGHGGIEAAMAAAKLGAQVLLLTMNLDTIGQMSCNPAIGGPAKSQLVKEIDALGGVMGLCADATYIQMKTLNASKGPAVRALRAQSDKAEYRQFCRELMETHPNIKMRQTSITRLVVNPNTNAFEYVEDFLGIKYRAKSVVITTGTFLNGKLWIGEKSIGGGRPGESNSTGITGCLMGLGLKTGRLKTGTPPRLDGRTIDYSNLEIHPGDAELSFFSFLPDRPVLEQLPCHLTRTNEETHKLIDAHIHRSPMMMGLMEADLGPRYCPSIEDKVSKFREKDSHHLFVEPEGRNTYEVYLQGFSTCLPYDIQVEMVRTLPGLERAEIIRPACAVEYDYFPAYQLYPTMMAKNIPGVFLAGQINGTSGYEEAGAQGLVAGINAARYCTNQSEFVLGRETSYIGTLVDDLVTKEIMEPYRMLTSRSEYRLLLRQDNADQRLTPLGRDIGLVDDFRWEVFNNKQAAMAEEKRRLEKTKVEPSPQVNQILTALGETPLEEKTSLYQLLRRPKVTYEHLKQMETDSNSIDKNITEPVEISIKYLGYIQQQERAVKQLSDAHKVKLPVDMNYFDIKQLSNEAKEKLDRFKPVDLGQASRIPGITPSDIQILQVIVGRKSKSTASQDTATVSA